MQMIVKNNMKRLIFLALLSSAPRLIAAPQTNASPAKPTTSKVKPAAPAKPVRPANVPPEAKLNDDGFWRYVDKSGKAWIYQPTPFGLMKHEEIAVKKIDDPKIKAQVDEADKLVKAVEDGDLVRFTRPGPFGLYSWSKKKAELTDEEKAILERSAQAKPETQSATHPEIKD